MRVDRMKWNTSNERLDDSGKAGVFVCLLQIKEAGDGGNQMDLNSAGLTAQRVGPSEIWRESRKWSRCYQRKAALCNTAGANDRGMIRWDCPFGLVGRCRLITSLRLYRCSAGGGYFPLEGTLGVTCQS